VDLAAMPIGTEALLLEGEPQGGHWLEVLPRGTESNRDGIGTKVIAYSTDASGQGVSRVRQASCGEGMLQQNSRWLHFGLGEVAVLDSLEIRWPMGSIERMYDVPVDQRLLLVEGLVEVPANDCPGDIDGSGLIGVEDLLMLLESYGCQGGDCPGDIDGDGIVGAYDILFTLSLFGEPCPN
jgi:hypothetical protein